MEDYELKKGQSNSKKIASSLFNQTKSGSLLRNTLSFLGKMNPITLFLIGILVFAISFILLIVTIFPTTTILGKSDTENELNSYVKSSISPFYTFGTNEAKEKIIDYINEKYECDVKITDFTCDDGNYVVSNDNCEITIEFTPKLSDMSANVTSYIYAVNKTIEYFTITDDENETNDELSYEELLSSVSSDITTHDFEILSKYLSGYSYKFFKYDDDTTRWDNSDIKLGAKKIYIRTDNKEIVENSDITYEMVEIDSPAYIGTLKILMFYDLSSYRENELIDCVNMLDQGIKDKTIGYSNNGSSAVSQVLHGYYDSYLINVLKQYESDEYSIRAIDNRQELFNSMLKRGYFMFVPISGLTQTFLEGEPGKSGENGFDNDVYDYSGKSSKELWKHIHSQIIYSNEWNCTAFAESYFYDKYGYHLSGDGSQMADILLNSDFGKENFVRGSSPSAGGIFSIYSTSGGNHVGCVDSIDYENEIIVISEGNTNGVGNSENREQSRIEIKEKMTFSQFENYLTSMCHGVSSGCWVTYANPKE